MIEKPRFKRVFAKYEAYAGICWVSYDVWQWQCEFEGCKGLGLSPAEAFLRAAKAIESRRESDKWIKKYRAREAVEAKAKWLEMNPPKQLTERAPSDRAAWWKPGSHWLS